MILKTKEEKLKMRIQYLECGLASQMRQYVFARYAERKHPGERWFFDDSDAFVRNGHNGYELERIFGIKARMLSDCFNKQTWEHIIVRRRNALLQQKKAGIPFQNRTGIILPQILLEKGVPITLVRSSKALGNEFWFDGDIIYTSGFDPEILELPYRNIYYYTYPAKRTWFEEFREENLLEFTFPRLLDETNQRFADMLNTSYSVGIHVRRGDFLLPEINRAVPNENYKIACQQVMEEHPSAHFFIFSDDLEWCRANEKELGFDLSQSTTYVAGNTGKNSYIDMQLLSMCKGMIRNARSAFSQVAGWLNPNLEFEIKLKKE